MHISSEHLTVFPSQDSISKSNLPKTCKSYKFHQKRRSSHDQTNPQLVYIQSYLSFTGWQPSAR